ncbi:MAG TPA: RlmE family RNA methyltransferase [Polyangiaceae bacterium]|nr:RlmE family RNA methyltransferase [Polyangiaceae bacterium]
MKYERKDAHYKRAKAEGLRARSAYKLIELDDRYRLFRKGDRVVDLGAWPGGWCQVAVDRVGPSGRVIGVDQVELEALPARNVQLIVGDVRDAAVARDLTSRLGGLADVVLSDVAPKLTGVRDVDEARCSEVVDAVVELLPRVLKPGGRALLKLFMNGAYRAHLTRLEVMFEQVRVTRPEASRRGSAELYVLGSDFGPASPTCG